MIFYRSETFES